MTSDAATAPRFWHGDLGQRCPRAQGEQTPPSLLLPVMAVPLRRCGTPAPRDEHPMTAAALAAAVATAVAAAAAVTVIGVTAAPKAGSPLATQRRISVTAAETKQTS